MHVLLTCFLGLYLAHLLTDFVLQSDQMVTGKRRGAALAYLEHGAIHFVAAALILGFAIPGLTLKIGFYGLLLGLTGSSVPRSSRMGRRHFWETRRYIF
jgi:hypothetical protein